MTSKQRTRAIVAENVNSSLQLQDVLLEPLQADEALVEIQAVGICHAEISSLNGTIPVDFPRVFGHEGAGVVKSVGPSIHDVSVGSKALLSFNYCQSCRNCRDDRPSYCEQMWPRNWGGKRSDGSHTMTTPDGKPLYANYFGQSSFSHLAVVNVSCLVVVPDDVDLEVLAPLGCGVQTGMGTITNSLDVPAGSSVAIFGVGAVGLCAVMAAKIREASVIIAVDLHSDRLELAKELGATHAIRGDAPDILEQIERISTGLEFAMDTTGAIPVIENMIKALGTRGKAAIVGAPPPGKTAAFDVFGLLNRGKIIMGAVEGDSLPKTMIPWMIEQWRAGMLPIEKIVRKYPIEDAESAIEDMRKGKTVKPVLVWK